MKIQMTLDGVVIATATLDNNDSARDFAAMFPLHLTLKDYAATEKIADLPRALTTKGAPEAYTPSAGDISYFAPWGNLAIFYKDGHLSSGLVRLGRLDTGIDAVRRNGPTAVKLERVGP
ncbi:cyclophilin-like fold protein [Pseudomonas brenneri]|uniref:cyclophilin-like fold protein n=1 Tax=Pseudomonas brenneri TaxID=129817 RepID=UPI003570E423